MFEPITRFVGRTSFKLKEASPTIATVAGITALIGAGVMLARSTREAEPILDELREDLASINNPNNHPLYMDEGAKQDARIQAYSHSVVELVKRYAPSVGLAVGGATLILWGHGVMRKRNAALAAAYTVVSNAFQAYRERVSRSYGEEAERNLYTGSVLLRKEEEDGTVRTAWWKDQEPTRPGKPSPASPYSFEFGPENGNWNRARPEWNLVFLRQRERYMNDMLKANGVVLLNDVLDGIGIPRTKAGLVVGWVWNGDGDNEVDFGLPEKGSSEEQDYFYFFNGEDSIFLDFNVDGVITDAFKDKE